MTSLIKSQGMNAQLSTRLLSAVMVKALIEILLVCAAVTLAAFAYFNPALRGDIEIADAKHVQGWASDPGAPNEKLDVQLFIDQRFFAAARAEIPRDDLVARGTTRSPLYGFDFTLADKQFNPGRHRAEVFVVHKTAGDIKTLLPIGKGKRFFQVD